MAGEVGSFMASWKSLHADVKKDWLAKFKPKFHERTPVKQTGKQVGQQVKQGVELYSYYSYLYYYPTIHWSLDNTPDSNDYWVGIFDRNKPDDKYITYQWLGYTTQGSYYCGELNTTKGKKSRSRTDEYELRIFKGSQRLDYAKTNILRGKVIDAPCDPSSKETTFVYGEQIDSKTREFLSALETAEANRPSGTSSIDDLHKKWNMFTPLQQQLVFPILEQDSLPDKIKQPSPKAYDFPEPKICFPNLGKEPVLTALTSATSGAPSKIALTISLDYAYTYIYPVVNVTEVVPTERAWMGVYSTKSDVCFNPNMYIDDDWQWVGNGQTGVTKLKYMIEKKEGPTNTQYVGAIFDYISSTYQQIGLAKTTIEAVISATPKSPPVKYEPDFDKEEALRYAKLSQLAYKPYATVEVELKEYGLKPEMRIYDNGSDTNGFIASDGGSVVVAFRGTQIDSWRNILTDIWFRQVPVQENDDSYAHEGFVTALNAVYSDIIYKLQPFIGKKKLFITGHSLGGALATLLGYRISLTYPASQPIQYVYGCPPVGDIQLSKHFRGKNSNTITIVNDPVSSGGLILLGAWVNLYKPYRVYYLPEAGCHGIAEYIEQLEKLDSKGSIVIGSWIRK